VRTVGAPGAAAHNVWASSSSLGYNLEPGLPLVGRPRSGAAPGDTPQTPVIRRPSSDCARIPLCEIVSDLVIGHAEFCERGRAVLIGQVGVHDRRGTSARACPDRRIR
jgi:hypothetical protein